MAEEALRVQQLQLYTDLKRLQVSVFSGYSHEDAVTWIQSLTNRVEAYAIPQDRCLGVFRLLLSGVALQWYQALPAGTRGNWQNLVGAFNTHYVTGGELRQGQRLAEFNRAEQNDLSARQFFELLQTKSIGLNIEANVFKSQFIAGLNPSIRDQIILLQPETLTRALEMAEVVEGNSRAKSSQLNAHLQSNPTCMPNDQITSLLQKVDSMTDMLQQTLSVHSDTNSNAHSNTQYNHSGYRGQRNMYRGSHTYSRGRGPWRGGPPRFPQGNRYFRPSRFPSGSGYGQQGYGQRGNTYSRPPQVFRCSYCNGENHKDVHCMAKQRDQQQFGNNESN